jgi:hypothetical protein
LSSSELWIPKIDHLGVFPLVGLAAFNYYMNFVCVQIIMELDL